MEIPDKIKDLYRHWDKHVVRDIVSDGNIAIPERLQWFIHERVNIWEKKTSGAEPPYTSNDVLNTYRFCNVFREFDRQTIEFHTHLNPLRDNFPLWLLNMFYFRMVARTSTVDHVGLLSFDEIENEVVYEKLIASPRPRFGTPYVFPISVIQTSLYPTREIFIARYLPKIMPDIAKEILTWESMSVYDGIAKIIPIFGFNLRFLWTEVLIDVAYQFPEHISLFTRFPIGPGSAPTFATWFGDQGDPTLFVEKLASTNFTTSVTYNNRPLVLSAENWEGIGCEFRKFNNLTQGKGRKRLYKKI